MNRDFPATVTAAFFILAAVLIWLGWMAMPAHIGTYFVPGDFAAVMEHFHLWIWMFRLHLFGFLIAVMALVALGTVVAEHEARVVVWPGVAVAAGGLFVSALAAAFYYHHGAWGALQMDGQPPEVVAAHVQSLLVDTEYVTCLVRFGRVFFGLGQVVLGLGILRGKLLSRLTGMGAVLLGVAAMALTMGLPDNLEYYSPIFHLNCIWLLWTGVEVLRTGAPAESAVHPALSKT